MKNNKNKAIILTIIAVATLVILVGGATYAYFTAQGGEPTSANLNVTTYTTDVFTFTTGDDISIYADQSSFASGKDNATGSTFARAILTANNKTNTATEHYYVYLNISNNSFTYSINESTPELILTVTNSAGTEVTDISGLTHTSVTDGSGATISGFDVTTKDGVIAIANNREITASPSKEETWNIKLTFVNYDENQNGNAGKSMSAKVMIQKEVIPQVVSDVCTNGENLATCITTLAGKSPASLTKIYYHDANLTNGAGDNSYRYAGANPNNYVCFGSTATSCPTDNLYRIIGVFGDQVKLIKYDYANSNLLGTDGDYSTDTYSKSSYSTYKGELTTINRYYWNNSTQKNTWSESNLNKVNLNTNFINNIRSEWTAKIAETTWRVGGFGSNCEPAKAVYQKEINPSSSVNKKIGLMYASDYGFVAAPSAWTTNLYDYDGEAIKSVNWMYMGLYEWTISRGGGFSDRVFDAYDVSSGGRVSSDDVYIKGIGVRPSFNLESAITYVSGSGSANDPIVIN